MAQEQTSKPAPAPAHMPTQTESVFNVQVPGEMIGMPGAGMITVQLPTSTKSDQIQTLALEQARAQASQGATKTYGLKSPDGQQDVGFNLPDLIADPQQREIFQQALASMPQLASFIAQLTPGGKAFSTAASVGVPAITRAVTNLIEGRPAGEGVIDEAAMGGAVQLPFLLGQKAMKFGEGMVRHNIFKTTPVEQVTARQADVLPKLAIETRASATAEGVKDAMRTSTDALNKALVPSRPGAMHIPRYDPKLKRRADDLSDLAGKLRDLTHQTNVRGTGGGGVTSVLPGSGLVTTGARATGLPAAVGQIASPAVAALKGSPARRIAIGRNLHTPGGVVDSDTLGNAVSQLMRLLAAANDPGSTTAEVSEQYVAPPPRRRAQ